MEALIRRVIALEQQGKDAVKATIDRQSTIDEEIAQEAQRIEADLTGRMNKKVEHIRTLENTEAIERVAAIAVDTEKSLAGITQRFEQNYKAWEEELFKKIIGR